ncbi:MAG: YigZ family protein [Oscillospiraceae bacterium]|nr:YigZ family protein [Oscillospiraceae bacterium]MBQ9720884.1 YigZ family protein [Oscillospiraceae bacterium]
MSDTYFVPCAEAESEFTEKRSRFIGRVRRVETEADARAYIEKIKKQHYDARHNCWCYIVHDGGIVRYGDDGEPQGTAGQPMLNVFQREGVENVVCVVTRYFGGVLLGAGGLTRAYGKSAKDALDAAGKARMTLWTRLRVSVPYPLFERLTRLVDSLGGAVEGSDYGADVTVTLRLPQEQGASFEAALTELSGGGVSPEMLDAVFLPQKI